MIYPIEHKKWVDKKELYEFMNKIHIGSIVEYVINKYDLNTYTGIITKIKKCNNCGLSNCIGKITIDGKYLGCMGYGDQAIYFSILKIIEEDFIKEEEFMV